MHEACQTSDAVLDVIRRELRRVSPDVRINNDQIEAVLVQEVLKRDVVEGEKAEEAKRKVGRVANRLQKKAEKNGEEEKAKIVQPDVKEPDAEG